jgi:hypothetical protein
MANRRRFSVTQRRREADFQNCPGVWSFRIGQPAGLPEGSYTEVAGDFRGGDLRGMAQETSCTPAGVPDWPARSALYGGVGTLCRRLDSQRSRANDPPMQTNTQASGWKVKIELKVAGKMAGSLRQNLTTRLKKCGMRYSATGEWSTPDPIPSDKAREALEHTLAFFQNPRAKTVSFWDGRTAKTSRLCVEIEKAQ